MGYDLEENVADILIAGIVMHAREKMGDAVLTGSLHVEDFPNSGKKPWESLCSLGTMI